MRQRKHLYPLAIVSGILVGLSVILPDILGALAWISLVPFFVALLPQLGVAVPVRRFFLAGFLYYLFYGLTYFHWFWALFPLDFTGLGDAESIVVILLGWVGLSALYALLGGALFLLLALFTRLGTFRRAPALATAILPVLFVLYEFILTLDWWGVPWGKLAISQSAMLPVLQTASLFGSYFIAALIVFVNISLAFLLTFHGSRMKRALPFAIALFAMILNTVTGIFLYQGVPVLEKEAKTVKIAVVQGNNPSQEDITDLESFEGYIALSVKCAEEGADVILWPESSIAGAISDDNYFGLYAKDFAHSYGVHLIVGATSYRDGNEYNTMTYFDREGNLVSLYDKRHLVPFGEYVPYRTFFETFIPPLVEVTMLDQDNTPGTDPAIFDCGEDGKLGGLICFESIYERLALDTVRAGAEVFVVGTNDSWFRESLATSMHTSHEQLRSIECGRYSTRAACTGLTCIINARGEIVESLPLYEAGAITYEVPRLTHSTLYARTGDLVVPLCAALLGVLLTVAFIRYRKEEK